MKSPSAIPLLALLIVLILSGCLASEPTMIASYPQRVFPTAPPGSSTIVYEAYLELEVRDPERAAEKAAEMAVHQGGYRVSSQTWFAQGQAYTTVVLAVPAANFDALRRVVLELGELAGERVVADRVASDRWMQPAHSQLTVHFRPRGSAASLPQIDPGWRPLQTLRQAWGVFLAIFGFILDVLIWVSVVIGPFALSGWLLWKLWNRKRRS